MLFIFLPEPPERKGKNREERWHFCLKISGSGNPGTMDWKLGKGDWNFGIGEGGVGIGDWLSGGTFFVTFLFVVLGCIFDDFL